MTATLVQSNTATNSTTVTSMTVTLPAGVTGGNLLVLLVGEGSNLGVIGPPSGWSVAYNKLGDGQPIGGAIFYRLVDAATAGQTSWTVTLSTKHTMTLAVQEWSASNGWVAPDPLDQQTFQYVGSSTALDTGTSPALTNAPDLVVANLSYHTALQSLSGITAGYTLQSHVAAGTGVSLATLSRQETASGVTERCQATIGTATVQVSGLAAFSEAAPVGGGTTYDGAMAAVGGASGALAPTRILSPTTLTVTGSSASALAAQARLAGRMDATAQGNAALAGAARLAGQATATAQGNATLDPVVRGVQQAQMSAAGGAGSTLTGQARLAGLLVAAGAGNAILTAAGSSLVVAAASASGQSTATLTPIRLLAPTTMRGNGGGTADLVAEKRLVGLLAATSVSSSSLQAQRLLRAAASASAGSDAQFAARLLLTALLDPATGGADAALLAERLGLANPTPVVLLATLLATLEATAALTPPLSATAALLTPLAATGSLQTDGPTATASLLTPSPIAAGRLEE